MPRFIIPAVVLAVVLTVYGIIDCAMTDPRRARALSKPVWIVVVIFVPVAGSLMWLLFGKMRHGAAERMRAPDDDETFLRSLRVDAEHRARIHELEDEIAALDEQTDPPGESPHNAPPREGSDPDAGEDPGTSRV